MELLCFELTPGRVEIRPSARRRSWMEDTHAYHCLPLVHANLHGWEMLCPVACEVVWRGGPANTDVEVTVEPGGESIAPDFVRSHFGAGTVTFQPSIVLRTPPGINTWITGPMNSFKDGVQAMNASIETDWMPFVFTMTWKLTRPNLKVRFERGEPFGAFFPITRGMVASCEPRLKKVSDDPVLAEQIEWARARRDLDSLLADKPKDVYQKWYTNGEFPNRAAGQAPADHERNIVARPFER